MVQRMTGVQFAACSNDERAIKAALKGTHDLVIASIAREGRRTTGVTWVVVGPRDAPGILDAAHYPEPHRTALLDKLREFDPAVLVVAEADYEPSQVFRE